LEAVASAIPPSPPDEDDNAGHGGLCKERTDCPKVDRCIHDLIEEQAIARPDQEGICAYDGSLSYEGLSKLSSALAGQLKTFGARPEQRVAILMNKSFWYPVVVLAVLKSGAAFVPLDPSHPENRLKQLIGEIEPCALITTSILSDKAEGLGCPSLAIDLADLTRSKVDSTAALLPDASANPRNAAYIIFTSGSTGKPKGVVIEHSALSTSAITRGGILGLGPDSRVLQYAPHTFDVSVDEILTTLIHGGCVCVPSENDRFSIAHFMESARVTVALLTPTSARTLHPDEVPSLRILQTGGEVLTEDVNDKWSDRVTLFNVYGPTEASVACVISNRTGLKGAGHVLGQAVGGKLWVADPDDIERRLPDDEVGELVISGAILARGYFRDPSRTESSFVRLRNGERVYRTGDLASMDSAGTIMYHGRKDLEVKIRGQRINIAEIEIAILQCDFVHSVVVEYPRSGLCEKKLVAVLRFEDSSSDAEDGLFGGAKGLTEDVYCLLLSHVSSVLTPAMIPSKWLSLPCVPQTPSGKADRKQVRGWLENMDNNTYTRIFHPNGTANLISDPSDSMVAIWLKVLKLAPQSLRLDQSFIRNGGDSIMAMEVRHRAHEAGINIDVRELLGSHTLQKIGEMATTTSALEEVSKIEDDRDEPFPLSPVQQMYFDKVSDPSLGLQQRVYVEIIAKIQPDMLREALNHVVQKHRMLAARFTKHMGQWMQQVPFGKNFKPLSCCQIYSQAVGSLGDFCTEPMVLEDGTLLHAHLQSSGERQTLVLCVHHLVVDFVSWRVILQDLHDALVAAQKGVPIGISRSTLTFQQWCREQTKYASTLTPETVLPFAPGPVNLRFWQPSNVQAVSNTYSEIVQHDFRLSSTQTTQMLEKFTTATIHPTDVMLATFALAFKRIFTERDTPTIFIEGHGREPWHASLDVSQTVGWFTAAFPIHLPKDTLLTITTAILGASERRRSVLANGHPYWACRYLSPSGQKVFGDDPRHQEMEFVFNYAGSVVQRAPGQTLFAENVRIAEIGHPNCERFSLFDISAAIEMPSSELVVSFTLPKGIAHRERVGELVKTYQELLETVVEHNLDLSAKLSSPLVCPADVVRSLEVYGVCIERDVEVVYTPSSIQQHMLKRQSQEPWFYRVQGNWTIEKTTTQSEPVDIDRLSHAWNQVVHRHTTLRTVFRYSNEEERFVAIVLHEIKPAISIIRKGIQTNGSLCRDDDLSPPHRMFLREIDNGSVVCKLEFSHTIIDAASRSIVMQDFVDAYDGKLAHRPLDFPPFWEYVRLAQSSTPSTSKEELHRAGRAVTLPFQLTHVLSKVPEACKKNEITISSFFMTAWSIVLAKHFVEDSRRVDATSSQAVAFDYVLSDRSADIPGIESAVGPYIRLPTLETHVKKGVSLKNIARGLHAQCTFQSLSQSTQDGSSLELPSKATALQKYSTLVNIRNSGSDSLDLVSYSGEVKWILQGFSDPWDYDLVFAVNVHAGKVTGWTVEYADGVVEHSAAEEISGDLIEVVERMVCEMI
jgi:amino acid adenylation domain-containing protein